MSWVVAFHHLFQRSKFHWITMNMLKNEPWMDHSVLVCSAMASGWARLRSGPFSPCWMAGYVYTTPRPGTGCWILFPNPFPSKTRRLTAAPCAAARESPHSASVKTMWTDQSIAPNRNMWIPFAMVDSGRSVQTSIRWSWEILWLKHQPQTNVGLY